MASNTHTTRRAFGCVLEKKDKNGRTVGWMAQYADPKKKRHKVYRQFPTAALAREWLEGEELLVRAYKRGTADWTHPRERDARERARGVLFMDWADEWMDKWGRFKPKSAREPLAPATLRRKRLLLHRVKQVFGMRALEEISVADVNRWLDTCGLDATPKREAYIMLRAIMRCAVQPPDGRPALLDRSPCMAPIPRRVLSDKSLMVEVSAADAARIKSFMPAYTAVSVNVLLAFGLRIGELCALRVDDFDFDRMVVHIRHSIRRGPDDTGELRLAELKTVGSMDALPIPPQLVPVLREHIDRFTDAPRPGAMLLRPAKSRVMSDRTLRTQLEKAAVKAGRPDVTPHAFRATAISRIIHEGGEIKDAQLFARHTDPLVTVRFYERTRGEQTRRELSELAYGSMFTAPRSRLELEHEYERAQRELARWADRCRSLHTLLEQDTPGGVSANG